MIAQDGKESFVHIELATYGIAGHASLPSSENVASRATLRLLAISRRR